MAAAKNNKKKTKPVSKKKVNKPEHDGREQAVRYQITVICLFVLAVFSFLAIYAETLGIAGNFIRGCLGIVLGGGAYLFPLWFVGVAVYALRKKGVKVKLNCYISAILLVMISALAEAWTNSAEVSALVENGRFLKGGGILGGGIFMLLRSLSTGVGAVIILLALIAALVIILTRFSLRDFIKKAKESEALIREEEKAEQQKKEEKAKKKEIKFDDFVQDKPRRERRMEIRPLEPIFDIPLDDEPVVHAEKEEEIAEDESIPEPPEELEYIEMDIGPVEPEMPTEPQSEEKKEPSSDEKFVPDEKEVVRYIKPPITLLTEHRGNGGTSAKDIKINSQKLVDVLQSFGVTAKVIGASVGPTVTRYEIVAASGTKFSKISGLSEDIAIHMGVSGIRIAPVPERSAVGIEIPNESSAIVNIRECIETTEFSKSPSNVAFALGKDISGKTIIADISKMPHLLVAGSTGSGKSVCINTLILSIMYKSSPEDVKLLMIDPKVVELKVYNGIPHLVSPVVTDPKKAANALNWAVSEMSRRYKLFAENGVRDIKGYNKHVEKDDTQRKLEHIVIIIDELADLMMAAPNEVEDAIQRIAQLARAAGMHLVIATQRPSVNVITGVIKANIPSRIAFAVSSQIDSRTILNVSGAEKLLGKGDMLYHPIGAPKSVRVQGSFVSDEDVERVVEFVKNNSSQVEYNEDAIEYIKREPEGKGGKGSEAEDEEDIWDIRLPEAVEIVMKMGSASTSMLQRKMGVGYARAARMVDQLEQQGIVGPPDGSKPRELLMTYQQYLEMVNYNENVQVKMDEIAEVLTEDNEE